MSTLKRQIVEIPLEQLNSVDKMFGRMMKMDVENLKPKFKDGFTKTRDAAYLHFSMKSVYASFEIECIHEDSIRLKNGVLIESKLMAEVFRDSFELVFLVATLAGYDELDASIDDMYLKLFLDSWGTAFIECGNKWVEQSIAKILEEQEIYATHSFSPGQNNISLEMQTLIFQALKPEEIGVTLNDKFMMHPKKSISGILGIQTEKLENRMRPCDLCERKDTCPNAYS